MHAVSQTQAAVVRLWTCLPFSLRMMTPAPRKPMPVTMPCMTRLASPSPYPTAITISAEARPTRPSVRTPVGLPCRSRLRPKRAPGQRRDPKPYGNLARFHGREA